MQMFYHLKDYINQRLAKSMGWGAWGYCLHRDGFTMPHANGAGSIAVHATDALRFGYCLLRAGAGQATRAGGLRCAVQ